MCGIVGFFPGKLQPADPGEQMVADALTAISHRGPDMSGHVSGDGYWLGHTRLSIIDLSESGCQPMWSRDGRFVLSYNGEIYNYRELKKNYGLTGLRGSSDSEVVVELIAQQGLSIIEKLRGIFAFSVVDTRDKKAYLVRDQLGIKPLYFSLAETGLYFGSEVRAVLALGCKPVLNKSALHEWLYFGNSLGTRTLLEGIDQIDPGTVAEVDLQSLTVKTHRYWDLADAALAERNPSFAEAKSNTEHLIKNAVEQQLVGDVPVGIMLSGGIDSGTVAAYAAQASSKPIHTYSARFDFGGDDELPIAQQVSDKFGTVHRSFDISGNDVADTVDILIEHHGVPFSDAANIPLYLISKEIREECPVVLQGDGGDEIFGGYRRYRTLSHFPVLGAAARLLDRLIPPLDHSLVARAQRYCSALSSKDPAELFAGLLTVEDRKKPPTQVLSDEYRSHVAQFDPFLRYRQVEEKYRSLDLVNRMMMVDMEIILPDIFLQKVDRSTMANSVEARVPLLDIDLVEYVASLPASMKVYRGEKKYILKEIMKNTLPADVIQGKKKGFGVPFGHWVTNSMHDKARDAIGNLSDRTGCLDMTVVDRMFDEHSKNQRDNGFILWKLMMLALWQKQFKVDFG